MSEQEADWREERNRLGIAPSPLDQAQRFESFVAYEQVVVQAVEEERLTRLNAANKLSVYRPDLAKTLQEDEISRLQEDTTHD